MENGEKQVKQTVVMQWIVSLAVSVVSCSVLFVIFAAHLVQVQTRISVDSVRLDNLLQRQSQLILEISDIRRAVLKPLPPVSAQVTPDAAVEGAAGSEAAPATAAPATEPEAGTLTTPNP